MLQRIPAWRSLAPSSNVVLKHNLLQRRLGDGGAPRFEEAPEMPRWRRGLPQSRSAPRHSSNHFARSSASCLMPRRSSLPVPRSGISVTSMEKSKGRGGWGRALRSPPANVEITSHLIRLWAAKRRPQPHFQSRGGSDAALGIQVVRRQEATVLKCLNSHQPLVTSSPRHPKRCLGHPAKPLLPPRRQRNSISPVAMLYMPPTMAIRPSRMRRLSVSLCWMIN